MLHDLVDHDDRRGFPDSRGPGLRAGGGPGSIGSLHRLPGGGPQLGGEVTPEGEGRDLIFGVAELGLDAGDGLELVADGRSDPALSREEVRVDETLEASRPFALGQVVEGDEAVGLASPKDVCGRRTPFSVPATPVAPEIRPKVRLSRSRRPLVGWVRAKKSSALPYTG